jgi:hypothetical protein
MRQEGLAVVVDELEQIQMNARSRRNERIV